MKYCSLKDFFALIRAEFHSGTNAFPFTVFEVLELARIKGYNLQREKALKYLDRLINAGWVTFDGGLYKNVLWVYKGVF